MYGITFLNRDFSPRIQPIVTLAVDRLIWSSEGGPSQAQLSALADGQTALSLVELLRCPVEVWNDRGRVVWWGYLESVEFGGIRFDLASMANNVITMFTYSVDQGSSLVVQKLYTSWVSNIGSQADFGVKQKIISAGAVPFEQAASRRDQALTDHSRPRPSISSTGLPGAVEQAFLEVHLICHGWWETLGWKYYDNPTGIETYTIEGIGTQPIGDLAAEAKLAQSWQPVTSGWDFDSVRIKVSKAGAPVDNLVLSVYADTAGVPAGSVLSSGSLAGSDLSLDYGWVKVALTPKLTIGTGIYWLVFSRSSGIDVVNFYKFKVNEAHGYSRGALKIWNGSAWVARSLDADLNFTVLGSKETTLQVVDIAASSACGQFLTRVKLEDVSGLYSSPYRDGNKTGLQEIKDLLASGTWQGEGLIAFVDQFRVLHVRRKPAGVQLSQGEDGIVRNPYGQPAAEDEIVAQWVKIERPGLELSDTQFITRVEVRGDGKISLEW